MDYQRQLDISRFLLALFVLLFSVLVAMGIEGVRLHQAKAISVSNPLPQVTTMSAIAQNPTSWEVKKGYPVHSKSQHVVPAWDAVSEEEFMTAYEALRQYQAMQDVEITEVRERQKTVLTWKDKMETVPERLQHVETIVTENQLWLHLAVGAAFTAAAGTITHLLHALRKKEKKNGV
jgi:hypothetical protein